MSADENSKRVFSKESQTDAFGWKGVNKENSEKTTKPNVNHVTPPELERNEAAARGRSVADRLKKNSTNGVNESKINEDDDDPCVKKHRERSVDEDSTRVEFRGTPGPDPRFQQQNQTLRCYVMYTDFYRCEKLLGRDHEACTWFRDVFTSICPNEWIRRWDELRETGRFPWRDVRSQEELPGDY